MYFNSERLITQNHTFLARFFNFYFLVNFSVKSHENVSVGNMVINKHPCEVIATFYEVISSKSKYFTYPNLNSWQIESNMCKIPTSRNHSQNVRWP